MFPAPPSHHRSATVRPPNSLASFCMVRSCFQKNPSLDLAWSIVLSKSIAMLAALHDSSLSVCCKYGNSFKEFKPLKYLPLESLNAFNVCSCSWTWTGRKGKDQECQGYDTSIVCEANSVSLCLYNVCIHTRDTHAFMPRTSKQPELLRWGSDNSIWRDHWHQGHAGGDSESCRCLALEMNKQFKHLVTESYTNCTAILQTVRRVKDLFQAIEEPGMQPLFGSPKSFRF